MTTKELEEAKIGDVVGARYRTRREIARGGMGLVFEAEHLVTGQRVALKALTRVTLGRADVHARLLREARVLGALRHPNVVLVQDAGECAAHGPFIALELIEGRPLDGILLTRHALPVPQVVALATQLCGALAEVHLRGFVHRDLKPSNVLISHTAIGDQVELIDFGIAKILGEEEKPETEKLTTAGEMLGTREYMSPEQLMGNPIDPRTDVYGAAAVLYECLTGDVPYQGPITAILTQMLQKIRPTPLRAKRAEIPEALDAAVMRGLEVDPAARFPSITAFARACQDALGTAAPPLALLEVRRAEAAGAAEKREGTPTVSEKPQRQRQHTRAPYVAPARILLDDGTHGDGRTEDLSEGGVLVVTQRSVPQDRRVKVRMPLPGSGRVVELAAVVRWVKVRRNVLAIGCEFESVPEDAKKAISDYVTVMTARPDPKT